MRRFIGLTFGVYALYLVKSAMGINISDNYTMPWWVKLPIAPIMQARDPNNWHG
jgi:hypothetical protein